MTNLYLTWYDKHTDEFVGKHFLYALPEGFPWMLLEQQPVTIDHLIEHLTGKPAELDKYDYCTEVIAA